MTCEILAAGIAALCLVASAGGSYEAGQKSRGKKAAAAAAPVKQPLKTTEFPDGTGTIGLPAGWVIAESYRGTAICRGPQTQRVTMGHAFVIARPDHPVNNQGIPNPAPLARDGDLVGALKGVLEKANNRLISLRVREAQPIAPGVPASFFLYELESQGKRYTGLGYFTALTDNDGTLPYWQLYCSVVMAPRDSFIKELPTMMEMWKSYRTNGAKPREGSAGAMIDEVIKDSTRRRAQTLKEQQEMYDRMNARFQATISQ